MNEDETIPKTNVGGFLNDTQYNVAKFLTVVVLPAIGTLYFALAQIWGLPSGEEVLGTILAFEAFLGVVLNISTNQYNNSGAKYSGVISRVETPEKIKYSLEMHGHPDELKDKDEATFKVENAAKD